jgi:hypothetical protein
LLQGLVVATRPLSHTSATGWLHPLAMQWLIHWPTASTPLIPPGNFVVQPLPHVVSFMEQLARHWMSSPQTVPWSHAWSAPQQVDWRHPWHDGFDETWSVPQPVVPVPAEAKVLVLTTLTEELETSMLVPVVLVLVVVVVVVVVPPWPPVPWGPSTTTLPPQAAREKRKKEARFMRASYP